MCHTEVGCGAYSFLSTLLSSSITACSGRAIFIFVSSLSSRCMIVLATAVAILSVMCVMTLSSFNAVFTCVRIFPLSETDTACCHGSCARSTCRLTLVHSVLAALICSDYSASQTGAMRRHENGNASSRERHICQLSWACVDVLPCNTSNRFTFGHFFAKLQEFQNSDVTVSRTSVTIWVT